MQHSFPSSWPPLDARVRGLFPWSLVEQLGLGAAPAWSYGVGQDVFGCGGDRVARAGRIQPMPGQGAKIGVELPAHHLRRGVRGIVLARRYLAKHG